MYHGKRGLHLRLVVSWCERRAYSFTWKDFHDKAAIAEKSGDLSGSD